MRSATFALTAALPMLSFAMLLGGCGQTQQSATLPASNAGAASAARAPGVSFQHACPDLGAGFAHCEALVRDDAASRNMQPDGSPSGYGPQDLWSAYNLTKAVGGGTGATI